MEKESFFISSLIKILEEAIKKIPKEKVAIAFSGGLDSGILARLTQIQKKDFTAYVVGFKGCKDFDSAKKVAKELDIELKQIIISKKDLEKSIPVQVKILQNLYNDKKISKKSKVSELKPNPVSISFNLPIFFVAKYAKEKIIISGQGADELLGGYSKYLQLGKASAIAEIKKDTKELAEFGFMQNIETTKYFRKKLIMPYLDKDCVNFSLNLPFEMKINNGIRKYLLRKIAEKIELSHETSYQEKKAAQYGSGIMKMMKKMSKDKGIHISRYIANYTYQ